MEIKRLFILLLLLFSITLFSNDNLNTFIEKQMEVEKLLMDTNTTEEKKEKLKKSQNSDYKNLFLYYSMEKEIFLKSRNPYRDKIYKLKLRYNSNKQKNYKNATLRDELLLKNYYIKNTIFNIIKDTLKFTDNKSEELFKDKLEETLIKGFTEYKVIDSKKYIKAINEKNSTITKDISTELNNIIELQYVANTFTSKLIDNSTKIYATASLSGSKFFSILNKINTTNTAKNINLYIEPLGFDTGKIMLIIIIILFILIIQKITQLTINYFLNYHKLKEDDILYIHTHITNIFNTITSLLIIHITIVVILGLETTTINISKVFAVLYIILTAKLIYRVTDTLAYLKVEGMKKSALLKNEVVNLSLKVINGLIIIVAIIVILKVIGVDLTALLSGIGIAGAAVAFAAKDSIANIFGSVAILAGDIFEQGDWIETDSANGTVVEIGLRATTIRTFDNALISVPNFELSSSGVKNWTRRRIGRRIKMNIGVTYESDFNDIKKAIEDIREMLKTHNGIANEHTTFSDIERKAKLVSVEDFKGIKRTSLVYMDEFADSSINILIYCFSKTVDWTEWLEVKEDVMFKIAKIMKKNNLEFAYPTMLIHKAEEE